MRAVQIVIDVPTWAWGRRALDLQKFAPAEYAVTIMTAAQFQPQRLNDAGLLFMDIWGCPNQVIGRAATLLANHGCEYEQPWPAAAKASIEACRDRDWRGVCSTALRNAKNARDKFPRYRKIITLTPQLARTAARFGGKAQCIPTGIDHTVFQPQKPLSRTGKLRVGLVFQVDQGALNQKGGEWLAKPIMRQCADVCEFITNHRKYDTALSREEMVALYNECDVVLCTSVSEGTPQPPMEAMACGRTVISTNVGDMRNLLLDGQNGFLVGEYWNSETLATVNARMEARLRQLHADRELLQHMGAQARRSILEHRNWETLAPRWLEAICA